MINLESAKKANTVGTENYKQFALLLLAVSIFGFGTLGLYKPVLAPYLKSLGFGAGAIGITVGLLGLSKSLTNIPAGILSDKYGRKPVMIVGLIFFGLCYPLYLFSQKFITLCIARLVNGFGNSAAAQPAMTAVADLLGKRRAFGMGILESLNYLAISGFTILAGYMATKYGMLSPFYLGLPLCLIGATIAYKFVRETKPVVKIPASSPVEVAKTSQEGSKSLEECKTSGEVWRKLLSNSGFATMCYLGFMTKMVDEGILITLIPLVAASYGLNVAQIAGVIATGYLTFSLIQPITGFLSDRIGRKPIFILGLLLLLASALFFPYAKSYLLFSGIVILMKIGNAMLYPSLPAAAVDVSPQRFRGTGLSVYRTFRDAGVFGGPIIAGFALQILGRGNAFYFVAFMFALGAILTAIFFRETINRGMAH